MSKDKPTDQSSAVDQQQVISEAPAMPETRQEKDQRRAVADFSRSKAKAKGPASIQIKVYSPFRVYYDGPAFSISAVNETGPFDVLPKHHNFISLLTPSELLVRTVDQGDQKIIISGGIMHVKADQIIVFLDV
ncbi:MAG TPA: F0F1 ATP synthase subunit epsilon [Candidatus Saccharimonadales bacterium]|nr:F0F1 ATP synthase subunit epsilon [Candidatus Saccharimonadales bacterium]